MFKNYISISMETAISRGIIAFICGAGFGAGIALKNLIAVMFGILVGIGAILDIRGSIKDVEDYARKDERLCSVLQNEAKKENR